MSAFKDAIEKDVKSVFLNIEEFADVHTLNGKSVRCVLDTILTDEHGGGKGNISYEGVFLNTLTIYVASADIETRPVKGELLYLDDKNYFVQKVSDESGVLVVIVEANEQ